MKKATKTLLISAVDAVFGCPYPIWSAMCDLAYNGNCVIVIDLAKHFKEICERLNLPVCGGAIINDYKTGEAIGRCFYVD